jgi:hypothetical protein
MNRCRIEMRSQVMRVGKNNLVVNVLIVQFTREWRERLTVALDRNLVLSPLGMYPSQKNCVPGCPNSYFIA